MVDRYYRKIESIENEIENSVQISSILLKLKEYDEKLSDLSKIDDNKNDIDDNKNDITNNPKNISFNKNDINNNKTDIDNNKNNITDNQKTISFNKNNINNNKTDIDTNKNNILNNMNLINTIYIYIYIYYTIYIIFEKEMINDFKKDSMLEIILKVLTEISHYLLIGFFEILCNFYDDNNKIFYTISLSTAMGSINKLSTIKSVFIVPINKDMTKIKIFFY